VEGSAIITSILKRGNEPVQASDLWTPTKEKMTDWVPDRLGRKLPKINVQKVGRNDSLLEGSSTLPEGSLKDKP